MYSLTIHFVDLNFDDIQKKVLGDFLKQSDIKYKTFHIYTVFQRDYVINSVRSDITVIVSQKNVNLPYRDNQFLLRFYGMSSLENDLEILFDKFNTEIKELETPPQKTIINPISSYAPKNNKEYSLKDAIYSIFEGYINGIDKDTLENRAMQYHQFKVIELIEQLFHHDIDKETVKNLQEHLDEIDLDELLQLIEAKQSLKNYGNISVGGDDTLSIGNKIKPIDSTGKEQVGKVTTVASNIASIDPFKGLFK
ncbi:hypothetical protein [Arcobacter sp. FWKO B]|uniref:hypothetical protein n=1 Tax=Arcobacter sp. FWKO B TaxID=2593672 RepID=UPI0018A4E77E|nr:hypothetical protein [Arcobacter sp. FWKO B]QOG11589.1 hypothetical protein FWKOB_02245 [Arcobacter sp. FWKO B]